MSAGIVGFAVVSARLALASKVVEASVTNTLPSIAEASVEVIKQHASGRPGPRVITDELRSSIEWVGLTKWPKVGIVIYTTKIYAPRVEFGWDDIDSAGRYIPTRPFPFFQPSVPEIGEIVQRYFVGSVRFK